MPYRRLAADILERWRAIERALIVATSGSVECAELEAEETRLRDEYQQLIKDAQAANRPEPPPFPPSQSPHGATASRPRGWVERPGRTAVGLAR